MQTKPTSTPIGRKDRNGRLFHNSIFGLVIASICIAYMFALAPQAITGL